MKSKVFNISYERLFSVVENTLSELDMVVVEKNIHKQYISARTKSSILSWGESINIDFEFINESKIKVIVESESNAQLIDWGTNEKNETRIINQLKKKL